MKLSALLLIILGGLWPPCGFSQSDSEDDPGRECNNTTSHRLSLDDSESEATSPRTPAKNSPSPHSKRLSFNEQLWVISGLTNRDAHLFIPYRHRILDTCSEERLHALIGQNHPDLAHLIQDHAPRKSLKDRLYKAMRRDVIDRLIVERLRTAPPILQDQPRTLVIRGAQDQWETSQRVLHKLKERYTAPAEQKRLPADFQTVWNQVPDVITHEGHVPPATRKWLIQHYPDTQLVDDLRGQGDFRLFSDLTLETLSKPREDLTPTQARTFKGRAKNIRQTARTWAVDAYLASHYEPPQAQATAPNGDLSPAQWAYLLLDLSQDEFSKAKKRYRIVYDKFQGGEPVNPHLFGAKKNRKGYKRFSNEFYQARETGKQRR